MGTNRLKWMNRAERYEEILHTQGLEAAEEYLMRFSSKLDFLMDALWDLQIEKEEIEREKQEEIQRLKKRGLYLKQLGIDRPYIMPEEP